MPTVVIPKSVEDKQKEEAKRLGYYMEHTHHIKHDDGEIRTIIELCNGYHVQFGAAMCSKKDQFSRRTGRVIARGRALKQIKNNSVDRVPQEK